MAPQRLFGIARRWWPILLSGVLLASVATFLLAGSQPQVFQVSTTLLPEQLRLGGDPKVTTVATSRLVGVATSYSYTARSREVLSKIGTQLGLADTVEALSKRVDATVDAEVAGLTITARAGTAAAAAALANAVAQEIEDQSAVEPSDPTVVANLEAIRTQILATEAEYRRLLGLPEPRTAADTTALGNALALLRELTGVYDSLSASINKTPGGLIVVSAADPLLAQLIQPRTLYFTLLAAVAGLLIAAAIASVLEYVDETVKSPEDIEAAANLLTLGTISSKDGMRRLRRRQTREPAILIDPRSGVAEAYRTLRSGVEFAADGPLRTLLLASSLPGEGNTITAANLAVAFAQAGRRVLLVDADLRKPGVHRIFDASNTHGLTTLLRNDNVDLDGVAQPTRQPQLRILTTGPLPPNPAELLGAERMRAILDRLKAEADLVILDGPPLQVVTDSAILSSFVDGTLLVIAAGRSRRDSVRVSSDLLARARARVLGAVLQGAARDTLPKYPDDTKAQIESSIIATRAGERANPT